MADYSIWQNYKKLLFVTLLCFLSFMAAHSQVAHSKRKENFDVHRFRIVSIGIPAPSDVLMLKNIRGVTVIDARADTATIGFMQKKVVNNASWYQSEQKINKMPTFMRLYNGCSIEAGQFARKYLAFSGNDSLPGILMVIKKLWLSD